MSHIPHSSSLYGTLDVCIPSLSPPILGLHLFVILAFQHSSLTAITALSPNCFEFEFCSEIRMLIVLELQYGKRVVLVLAGLMG